MRKSTTKRRSSSNPGIRSSQEDRNSVSRRPPGLKAKDSNFGSQDTMIPKPRIRSHSSDRLSGMRISNLRPTTGAKISVGHYATASSTTSPMSNNRYTHIIEKSTRPSLIDQGNRGRMSVADPASKGFITPRAGSSKQTLPGSDGRNIRASSAERAAALAPKGPKKDNRPITDKNYQNEMLNRIDNYFHSIGQSTILNNNGSLKPLTLKIFVDATNLLVRLLDMKQSLTVTNYVEEIPKIAKKLHYPGLINKSWLKTANTMHSWQYAIGWLCWLVELCEVKDLAGEIFTLDRLPIIAESEEEKEKHRKFFLIMIQCYQAFNEEKPEEEERIIEEYFQEEAEKRGINTGKHDQVILEYNKAKEKLEKEQAEMNKVNEKVNNLEHILNSLKNDMKKQQEHKLEQQKYVEKTLKDIDQLNKDSTRFQQDIEKLENTKRELDKAIEQQPMTIAERDEIVKNCTEQETYIKNFDVHLEEIKKESYSLDMQLVSSNTNLVKTILAYNQTLIIQLSDCGIDANQLLMPENGICEPDFMDRLQEKKTLMNVYIQEQNTVLSKNSSLLESNLREIEALQTKRETLSEKMEKKKASEEKRKQELKIKETKKRDEIKKLIVNIEELNESVNKTSSQVEIITQKISEVVNQKEAGLRKSTSIHDSAKTFFQQMDGILDDHRNKLKNSLELYAKEKST